MSNLTADNDRGVSQAARAVHEAFKRTPLRMGGSSGGGLLELAGAPSAAGGAPSSGGGGGGGAPRLSMGAFARGSAAVGAGGSGAGLSAPCAPEWDPELSDKAKEDGEAELTFCQVRGWVNASVSGGWPFQVWELQR
jgi:hypothetical protein